MNSTKKTPSQDPRYKSAQANPKRLHLWLIILLVCLLGTVKVWDHYFNSPDSIDRNILSTLILFMGTFFSFAAGFVVWTLESGRNYLEKEIQRRTDELLDKEREAAAAEARTLEAQAKQKEVEKAYARLQELQVELIQSEKLASVGRFVTGLVHELKTPLVNIQGYSRLLGEHVSEPDRAGWLAVISRQAERCLSLVQDLLTFARKEKIALETVSLNELLDQIIEELPLELKSDGIQISKQCPQKPVEIEADREQLRKLFQNLLINSWHALKEVKHHERKISITVSPSAAGVQVIIADNGSGISKENLAKVFEPFFTTKPVGQGTGLGLSLCYGIVGKHGGKIDVQSELGKGTVILIDLPRHPLHSALTAAV